MTYLIHGATGAQGAPVVAALARADLDFVAAVRDSSRYTGPGRSVTVDLTDADSLAAAYSGSDGVFVHVPVGAPDQQLAQAESIIAAVDRARPARVVVSTSGAPLEGEGAVAVLVRGLEATGVSLAVVAPRLYLENLLLPTVIGPVRAEGVLRYPIREDYAVSWSSHLDVADVVVRLLDSTVTGVVGVGAAGGYVGADLASSLGQYFGREVRFDAQDPADMRADLAPMLGDAAAESVAASYVVRLSQANDVIDPATSAQQLLGLAPRSIVEWLRDLGV